MAKTVAFSRKNPLLLNKMRKAQEEKSEKQTRKDKMGKARAAKPQLYTQLSKTSFMDLDSAINLSSQNLSGNNTRHSTSLEEKYEILENEKEKSDFDFIVDILKKHFIFCFLDKSQLYHIVSEMFYCTTPANEFVFQQGSPGKSFFLLQEGRVQVIIEGQKESCEPKILQRGDYFGDLALLYNAPRSAGILCLEDTMMWAIDGEKFNQ